MPYPKGTGLTHMAEPPRISSSSSSYVQLQTVKSQAGKTWDIIIRISSSTVQLQTDCGSTMCVLLQVYLTIRKRPDRCQIR